MSRKRMISPEFWSDEQIGSWSFEARLFYIGLWNFSDDSGKLKAHPDLLKAQIFPYDKKIDIEKLKDEIKDKVQWYDVDNSKYGFILNFSKYQVINRPQPSLIPDPLTPFSECSVNVHGLISANLKEVNIKEEKRREEKLRFQEFVFLDKDEHQKLITDFGKSIIESKITALNNYLGQTGKRYKSHYHTILNWIRRDSEDGKLKLPYKSDHKTAINMTEMERLDALHKITLELSKPKVVKDVN